MLQNALLQPAPARVGSSHHRASAIGQQHWQAVGHHHRAGHTGLRGDGRIGHRTVWRVAIDGERHGAMHLLQVNRTNTQRVVHDLPVG